jgi:hypothetical protein
VTPGRLATLAALHRFLREYADIPAREASKRLAAGALAVLTPRPPLDRRCRLDAHELLALPHAGEPLNRP